jgi:hypothetical protein
MNMEQGQTETHTRRPLWRLVGQWLLSTAWRMQWAGLISVLMFWKYSAPGSVILEKPFKSTAALWKTVNRICIVFWLIAVAVKNRMNPVRVVPDVVYGGYSPFGVAISGPMMREFFEHFMQALNEQKELRVRALEVMGVAWKVTEPIHSEMSNAKLTDSGAQNESNAPCAISPLFGSVPS